MKTATILKGWKSFSPGLRGTSYPGKTGQTPATLKGLHLRHRTCAAVPVSTANIALRTDAPDLGRWLQQSGGVLIVTLLLASILGITLGSYLYWVRTQNLLVAESQSWNSALALAEAGIEEGLSQINVNFGQGDPTAVGNYTNSAANNFGFSGGVYGPKTNATLGSGAYSVSIQPAQNAK